MQKVAAAPDSLSFFHVAEYLRLDRELVRFLEHRVAEDAGKNDCQVETKNSSNEFCRKIAQTGQIERRENRTEDHSRDHPRDKQRKPHQQDLDVCSPEPFDSIQSNQRIDSSGERTRISGDRTCYREV